MGDERDGTFVAGESASSPQIRAFLWSTSTVMQSMGTALGDAFTEAYGVSAPLSPGGPPAVVGASESTFSRAVLWSPSLGMFD